MKLLFGLRVGCREVVAFKKTEYSTKRPDPQCRQAPPIVLIAVEGQDRSGSRAAQSPMSLLPKCNCKSPCRCPPVLSRLCLVRACEHVSRVSIPVVCLPCACSRVQCLGCACVCAASWVRVRVCSFLCACACARVQFLVRLRVCVCVCARACLHFLECLFYVFCPVRAFVRACVPMHLAVRARVFLVRVRVYASFMLFVRVCSCFRLGARACVFMRVFLSACARACLHACARRRRRCPSPSLLHAALSLPRLCCPFNPPLPFPYPFQ